MQKTVTVTFHEDTSTLTLNPSTPIELREGDWVEWNFPTAPSGTLPIIEFVGSPFGPFQCLQSKSDNTVQGKGNVGEELEQRDYSYRAMLLDTTHARATSGEGVVRNLQQSKNTSPVAVVGVVEEENDHLKLNLPTSPLMLYPGDTALWHVSGLPRECFITFLFEVSSQDVHLNPLVGPFESLLALRAFEGEDPGVMRIIGVNFTPTSMQSQPQSQYVYQVAVRDSAGNILIQHEPVIDNLGPPAVPPPVSEVS